MVGETSSNPRWVTLRPVPTPLSRSLFPTLLLSLPCWFNVALVWLIFVVSFFSPFSYPTILLDVSPLFHISFFLFGAGVFGGFFFYYTVTVIYDVPLTPSRRHIIVFQRDFRDPPNSSLPPPPPPNHDFTLSRFFFGVLPHPFKGRSPGDFLTPFCSVVLFNEGTPFEASVVPGAFDRFAPISLLGSFPPPPETSLDFPPPFSPHFHGARIWFPLFFWPRCLLTETFSDQPPPSRVPQDRPPRSPLFSHYTPYSFLFPPFFLEHFPMFHFRVFFSFSPPTMTPRSFLLSILRLVLLICTPFSVQLSF